MSAQVSAIPSTHAATVPPSGPALSRAGAVRVDAPTEGQLECERITRARARNFYYGLKLLPEPKRSAMYSIYAWMRSADDAVDEAAHDHHRRARLDEFEERSRRVLGGEAPGAGWPAWWGAFHQTLFDFPLEPGLFVSMLEGMRHDLGGVEIESEEGLSRYCYRVASTVGLACLRVWGLKPGVDPGVAESLAIARGQAFQRTNILRDFAQDFDETPRRVYVPRDCLEKHGLTAGALRRWEKPGACAAVIAEQAKLTRRYYDESAALEGMIESDSRPTLWAMTKIYSGLLALIEEEPARVVGEARIRLSGITKTSIALRATAAARFGR